MKRQLYSLLAVIALLLCTSANAQDKAVITDKKEKEVIIRSNDDGDKKEIIIEKKKKDGQNEKTVIIVDGENVTVNGKPVQDFRESFHHLFDDEDLHMLMTPELMNKGRMMMRNFKMSEGNKAMLGVLSEPDEKGAIIKEITEGSAAEKAGLKKEDIITAINNDKVSKENNLITLIGKYKPEETISVTFLRDGKEKKATIKLDKRQMDWNWKFDKDLMKRDFPRAPKNSRFYNFNEKDRNLADNERPKFGFSIQDNENGEGVKVTDVQQESIAAKAGLKENDLITTIEEQPVKNVDAMKQQLATLRDKETISIKIIRSGASQSLQIKVPKKIKTADL